MQYNVINLPMNIARNMTDLKANREIYQKNNIGGKFDEAITGFDAYYDTLMDQVLER